MGVICTNLATELGHHLVGMLYHPFTGFLVSPHPPQHRHLQGHRGHSSIAPQLERQIVAAWICSCCGLEVWLALGKFGEILYGYGF